MVLLLATAVSADVVTTRMGSIEGTVTMSDSVTLWVVLPLGGTQRLPASAVRAVSFDDAVRFKKFEIPLLALGISVDLRSSEMNPGVAVPDAQQTLAPSGAEHAIPAPEPHDQSTLLATYQAKKRDPAMAGLLSTFVPTLGHVYAGEGGTGAAFMVGEVALVAAAILLGNAAGTDTSENAVIYSVMSVVCWTGAVVTKVCECGDAVNAASRHNQRLQERLGLQIGLQPQGGEATLGVVCRF
jgi:alpha-D-ribose 1-methylphosphonate 5-triphosphate synthase subunit PhnG